MLYFSNTFGSFSFSIKSKVLQSLGKLGRERETFSSLNGAAGVYAFWCIAFIWGIKFF